MRVKFERISRAKMSRSERQLRSRLNQLVAGAGLLRGTLTLRAVRCGKEGCRCTEGQPHQALYLTMTKDGATQQIYVPKRLEGVIRQWIEHHRKARILMEEISQAHWERLKRKEV